MRNDGGQEVFPPRNLHIIQPYPEFVTHSGGMAGHMDRHAEKVLIAVGAEDLTAS